MEKLLSRKFIVTILVFLASFALVLTRQLEAQKWFEWAVGLVAVYSIGNIGSTVANKLGQSEE